ELPMTGKPIALSGHDVKLLGMVFWERNNHSRASLWDVAKGEEIASFPQNEASGKLTAIALSPDAKQLAFGGSKGVVRVVDLPTGRELASLPLSPAKSTVRSIKSLSWSRDGSLLCAAVEGLARV